MNKHAWTLEELAEAVEAKLASLNLLGQVHDRRIAARPDGRTLRYYTSLGLLDPPLIEKRQARYQEKHLLQASLIKALQAAGYSLAQIQAQIFGLDQAQIQNLLESLKQTPQRKIQALNWLEIPVEPGFSLKLSADWRAQNPEHLLEEIRQILETLATDKTSTAEGDEMP